MKVECLVCGYEGEPQKVRPQIRLHWLHGIAEIDKVCPVCGDTALEEVNTGKNNVVIYQLLPEPLKEDKMKIVGKCAYCKDPIYDFQQKEKEGKLLYHKGCYPLATQSARY